MFYLAFGSLFSIGNSTFGCLHHHDRDSCQESECVTKVYFMSHLHCFKRPYWHLPPAGAGHQSSSRFLNSSAGPQRHLGSPFLASNARGWPARVLAKAPGKPPQGDAAGPQNLEGKAGVLPSGFREQTEPSAIILLREVSFTKPVPLWARAKRSKKKLARSSQRKGAHACTRTQSKHDARTCPMMGGCAIPARKVKAWHSMESLASHRLTSFEERPQATEGSKWQGGVRAGVAKTCALNWARSSPVVAMFPMVQPLRQES